MQYGMPIVKDVYWVGVNDRRTPLFEGLWPIPRGVSYNSYLILDEKTVLIDTVKDLSVNGYLKKLRHVLGPDRQIDYLVINHLEPDHSGAIPLVKKVFPNIQIVGNKKTAEFINDLYGVENTRIVADGEEIDLGRRKLKFFLTPMVHWPETMMTYETVGRHPLLRRRLRWFRHARRRDLRRRGGHPLLRRRDPAVLLEHRRQVLAHGAEGDREGLRRDVRVVASTHGPIWRSDPAYIIRLYDRWSRQETEPGVVVAFGSMYGARRRWPKRSNGAWPTAESRRSGGTTSRPATRRTSFATPGGTRA